jgi:division protein CdvB (Snf7/Vps24/ESCRT-III family)
MSQFSDKWEKKESPNFVSRLTGGMRNPGPLKPQLDQAGRQIQAQIARLDGASSRLKTRDATIFSRVVSSVQKHETQQAAVYANELAEIRKMGRMITQARLALEQIALRLGTITDLGDIVVTLAPTISVVRSVRQDLSGVLPEAEGEITEISSLLSSILVDAGSVGGYSLNFEAANEEAEKTLEEAAAVAEQRMKERFPEIPAEVQSQDTREQETA